VGSNQDAGENLKAACKLVTILRIFTNNVSFVMNSCQVGGQMYVCVYDRNIIWVKIVAILLDFHYIYCLSAKNGRISSEHF
jgi:hypothetical protein